MNILMINHLRLYRSWHRAGAFARQLVKAGHSVTLLVIADTEKFRFKEYYLHGIRMVECPDLLSGNARSGWDPVCVFRRIFWLAGCRETYDIIHVFETRPAGILPALWYSRTKKLPLVIDWGDWWGRGGIITVRRPLWYRILFGALETFFEEFFRRFAHMSTAICDGLCHRAVSLGIAPESVAKVLPGIDMDRSKHTDRNSIRAQCGFSETQYVVGYSSQDTFLDIGIVFRSIRLLRSMGCPVSMICIGSMPEKIKRMIAHEKLESMIYAAGYVPEEEYPSFLAAADVFIVPFPDTVWNRGRWPNKFGDYLAAGRPVVFNPIHELARFAENPPGIACGYTAEDFAESLHFLYANPTDRMLCGCRSREIAHTDFRWSDRVEQLSDIYRRAKYKACKNPSMRKNSALQPFLETLDMHQ